MSEHSIPETAERGGVTPDFVVRLIEIGIISPDTAGRLSAGDVRRVRLAHTFEGSGISLEALGQAIRDRVLSLEFVDDAVYERLSSLSDLTFADLSDRNGISVETLMIIREATGAALPRPDYQVRHDELGVLPFVEFMNASGIGASGIERLLRVYGEALRRMAESEADWWHSEMLPALSGVTDPAEVLEAAKRIPAESTQWSDQAVLGLYHAQQARAWTKSIVDSVEAALEKAGLYSRLERIPAISFLDVTGYTRLTEEHGDEAAAEIAEELRRMVERIAAGRGGHPIKWLGDGVMLHFPDPGAGVLASLEMVDKTGRAGLPPAHVGLHAGPVLFHNGDYYGRTVNVASRIADHARPGEVLVSKAVVDGSGEVPVKFDEIGPVDLKGVTSPTLLWTARSAQPNGS